MKPRFRVFTRLFRQYTAVLWWPVNTEAIYQTTIGTVRFKDCSIYLWSPSSHMELRFTYVKFYP